MYLSRFRGDKLVGAFLSLAPSLCSSTSRGNELDPIVSFSATTDEGVVSVTSNSSEHDVSRFALRLFWKRFAGDVVTSDIEEVSSSGMQRVVDATGQAVVDYEGQPAVEVNLYQGISGIEDGIYCRILKVALDDNFGATSIIGSYVARFEAIDEVMYELDVFEYDASLNVYIDGVSPDGTFTRDLLGAVEHNSEGASQGEIEATSARASDPLR